MKNLEEWERKTIEVYSCLFTAVKEILTITNEIERIYAQIGKSLASIQSTLGKDPRRGRQVVKLKKPFGNGPKRKH
jgi:hypothetical protein